MPVCAGHVWEKLKQYHLSCTDDLVSEPPSPRQNYLLITTVQSVGTIIQLDITMLSEVTGALQLQYSCRVVSFAAIRRVILGSFRHSLSGIGEQLVTGKSSVQENEVFKTPLVQYS